MARVSREVSSKLREAGLWREFTTRRKSLVGVGVTSDGDIRMLYESLLAGEDGDAVVTRIMKLHGLIPQSVHADVPGPEEIGGNPPALRLSGVGEDFWRRKAAPNDVVAWVVRNYLNPHLTEADFPDPSALTLLSTARRSPEMWQAVFTAYQKMVSSKTEERQDDGRIDGQREYDLLARFQELEAAQ